mmetsp:Transcript_8106/g.22399  ORF Transcript_8106/g.22399 Transcript_8106/m.22399 type:complete len:296 (-) Transcript_8106:239-1126(-)
MQADWQKLAKDYAKSRSVLIAECDCTEHQAFCGKYGIQGYPTIKAFKKGSSKPEDYNSGRDYNSFKRYVEANLAGPECSLEDKGGCRPDELRILEQSEAMSVGERRAKIKEMESDLGEKSALVKSIQKEIKDTTKAIELFKLGGEKPDRIEQLVGDAEFREHCEHRTCILTFLPHILDSGAASRREMLKTVDVVFRKAKAEGHPVGFMWLQGGDQFEVEEKLSLQFGFPAVVALSLKKERFGVHRGTFDKDSLSQFLGSMMVGRVPLQPIPKNFRWDTTDLWDGKDGEVPAEEEL